MNREIKFRAWIEPYGTRITGKMVYLPLAGLGYYDFEGSWSLAFSVDAYDGFNAHERYESIKPEFHLMEFTGLLDKNGKEIYEGDIVKYSIKKRFCKNTNCDEQLVQGIDRFCKRCGSKLEEDDFITIAKVVYDKAGFAYRNEVDDEHYVSWACHANEKFIAWVEVIGNIYESKPQEDNDGRK